MLYKVSKKYLKYTPFSILFFKKFFNSGRLRAIWCIKWSNAPCLVTQRQMPYPNSS
jgi:hypothetical protein